MALPSRGDLEVPRTAAQMLEIVRQNLVGGEPNAISDSDFFARADPVIKFLVEEYEPVALYLRAKDVSGSLTACLTPHGAPHDAEIRDDSACIERIQIVHGTESYSEALKREALNTGEIVMTNSEYARNKTSKAAEEQSICTSPREVAEKAADMVIGRIDKKLSKGYTAIDTLLVPYVETMSTPKTVSHVVITERLRAWLGTKTPADMSPFVRVVLVSDHERVVIMNVQ